MHIYLPHLLADIKAAHKEENLDEYSPPQSMEEHFAEIDRWISGDSEHTLSYFCGLVSADFPPAEQFSKDEKQQVCLTFEEMLASWGGSIDWPSNIPWDFRYQLTVGLLDKNFSTFNFGMFVFDFCTGYAPGCDLEKYCKCLEFWKDDTPNNI
jgi:hypothetical protein